MTGEILITFCGLLLLAILLDPLAQRARLPFPAALVLAGFIGSEIITRLGFDTGLRWQNFANLVLHVFVPALVFAEAFNMNTSALRRNIIPVLFLAIPLLLAAAFATGALLYLGINHSSGFPWLTALLGGALLAATDPSAVSSLLQRFNAPERLRTLLEGESLFNDGTTIVIYALLIQWALNPATPPTPSSAAISFLYVFVGGLLLGGAIAFIVRFIYRYFPTMLCRASLSLIAAVGTYYFAEQLHVSGIIALLVVGLTLGKTQQQEHGHHFVNRLWELNAYIANALIFLMAGATITLAMFSQQWLAMLIGIGAALLVRWLTIYGLLPQLWLFFPATQPVAGPQKRVLVWGGLRGAVTLALALALPTDVPGWYTVQSIAYGVVLFALFVQAPSLGLLLKRL